MERDAGTTLATKEDLRLLEQQLISGRAELQQTIDSVRSGFRKDLQAFRSDLRKDMDALLHSITLRFGVMLAVCVVVTISVILGALRLWL
jgi:hypothetical protein